MRVILISSSDQDVRNIDSISGLNIEHRAKDNIPLLLKDLMTDPPDAVVISLERAPMLGRDIALAIRQRKRTRQVRVIFIGGDQSKVREIRKVLPGTFYSARWEDAAAPISLALESAPAEPDNSARSIFDVYRGTPLSKKLGIRENSLVLLQGAPENFESSLDIAKNVNIVRRIPKRINERKVIILWFVKSRHELDSGIKGMAKKLQLFREHSEGASIWIIWQKKSLENNSRSHDLSQDLVRKKGLAVGMVDYKICSIDQRWSGLLFTNRKQHEEL